MNKDAVSPRFYSTCGQYLAREALEGFGGFKKGGQVIYTMKYTDDLLKMAKQQTVLQGMSDRPIEIGTYCGMEMNVEKTEVMRISGQPSPVQTVIDQTWRRWNTSTVWVA